MKTRISISRLIGFILSCLGVISIILILSVEEGPHALMSMREALPICGGIVILEIIAMILSIKGVKAASDKQLKLRRLGVAGIVISIGFLLVISFVICMDFMGPRESPPTEYPLIQST